MDHDIRVWLSAEQYLAVKRLADDDDRSVSGWVRALIRNELQRVSAAERQNDRGEPGPTRDV